MQIILLERIEKLGQMGDVVTVKDGYARNYLLPQKKALRATKDNLQRFEGERSQLEAQSLEQRGEAAAVAAKIDGLSVVLLRQASESAQLFGSVNARDIARAVSEAGFTVDRRQVRLPAAIKTLGIHSVRLALHPEVDVTVTINVARSEEEAKHQVEAGEALKRAEAAKEEVAVEEFFEDVALEDAEQKIAAAETEETEAAEKAKADAKKAAAKKKDEAAKPEETAEPETASAEPDEDTKEGDA